MSEQRVEFVESVGGAKLAVHRIGPKEGGGRPVLLLHGLFSSALVNWIKFGHAAKLAAAGFEAIMPDLRAHGQSDAPHDPAAYPSDVLVQDALKVVETLGLAEFDLCGFSLGSRTSVRAVLAGLTPRRLVLGGMGLEGLDKWERRSSFFIGAIDRFEEIKRGDPEYVAQQFMKSQKVDRVATRLLLQSVDDTRAEQLREITMPTLVVCGAEDDDNGSAPDLAAALPGGSYVEVPGTHMSSVTKPELGDAIVRFLSA
ncbi:MAG: alpha/beta fold hydrolase [Novosphingobium sp.]|nr:MAG: alpha/beta fold hydrolase [Novosphingobium sp.]